MSGLEGLVKALLKAMGFNPQEFIDAMQTFIAKVNTSLATIDTRFRNLEELAVMIETNAHARHIQTMLKLREIAPASPQCAMTIDDKLNGVEVDNISLDAMPTLSDSKH